MVDVSDALARAAAEELRKQTQEWSTHHASRHWHLTQLGNKSVKRAVDHLKRCGFDESYYPMTLVSRAIAKARLTPSKRAMAGMFREYIREPLFSGYLFVRVDLRIDRWQQAFRGAGVYGIACAGSNAPYDGNLGRHGEYDPISCDELVERLVAHQHEGAIPGATKLADLFQVGEGVRVLGGPFAGFNATIEEIDAKDIATVAINIFGRSTPIRMEFCDFEKL